MKISYTTIAGCLLAVIVPGGALRAERYGGEFLNIPVGAKAFAMGGAFGPVADDVSAIYWNPAGLSTLRQPEISVTHTELFGNLANHDFIGAAWPMRVLTVGAAWIRFGVDDIPRFSHTVGTPPEGSFGDNENAFLVSAASSRGLSLRGKFRGTLRYGGTIKIIYDRLDDKQATGTGLDAGLQTVIPLGGPDGRSALAATSSPRFGAVTLSMVATDIGGTAISWNTVRKHQDIRSTECRLGLGYTLLVRPLRTSATLSYETSTEIMQRNRFGMELSYRGAIALRAGRDGQGSTVGAGLAYWRLRLDYGFTKHDLGNSHRVSASCRL
jgi:hypothetical protein